MEQRTLLAIILSIMVLLIWGAITPKKTPQTSREGMQPIESKELMGVREKTTRPDMSTKSPAAVSVAQEKPPVSIKESIYTATSGKLRAEFSNIGGIIKEIYVSEHEASLPVSNIFNLKGFQDSSFALQNSGRDVVYSLTHQGLKINKRYELSDNDYTINATIEIENTTDQTKQIDVGTNAFTIDMSSLDNKEDSRDKILFEYSVATDAKLHRKDNAYKFNEKESKTINSGVEWTGFRDRYFCIMIKPNFDLNAMKVNVVNDKRMDLTMDSGPLQIAPYSKVEFAYTAFAGPQDIGLLKSYEAGFEKIVIFSRFGLIDGIARIIYGTLNLLHKFIPNWGVCIILVSFLVYGVTYPLTIKGMASMKRMQSLQPHMATLKEKHKNNPQKLNKEMMDLYKQHKVNPAGGCFLLFLQMPVFFGLYQVLWRAVSLKGASFLWIQDLSQPDKLLKLPFPLPFNGGEYFNLLPVLMGALMFVQQKITAKNMVTTDPAQQAQQKMMAIFLPVFMCLIFYKFASGLALYFTMFYLLSIFTQIKMSKMKHDIQPAA